MSQSKPPEQGDDFDSFVRLGTTAILRTFVGQSVPPEEAMKTVKVQLETAIESLKGRFSLSSHEIDNLIGSVHEQQTHASSQEVTRRNLARWFEVPLEEFERTPANRLEPEILFNHLYYETLFKKWFEEWGYNVVAGEELQGSEGADFTPDLFAELATLHGNFQIAVCFVSDDPPSHYRVLAMLENLEAFTRVEKEFSERDMFLLVTPYKFLGPTDSQLRIQAQEESYFVVALEGEELHNLENASDSLSRSSRMQHFVLQAASKDRPF